MRGKLFEATAKKTECNLDNIKKYTHYILYSLLMFVYFMKFESVPLEVTY